MIDYDAIAQALGSPDSHDHPGTLKLATQAAVRAACDAAYADPQRPQIWLIKCYPTIVDRSRASEEIVVESTPEECHERADATGRPGRWHQLIDEWFRKRDNEARQFTLR